MEQDKEAIIKKQNDRFITAMYRWCKADSAKTVVAEDILRFMVKQKVFDLPDSE